MGAGSNLTSYNLFAYCGNNPVNYIDETGAKYIPVGVGVQFEVDYGSAVVGIEIVMYWDVDECKDGAPVIAVYAYGGVSAEVNDALSGSIIALMTDNSSILSGGRQNITLTVALLTNLISKNFSVSASGFVVMGNEQFTSTRSYEQSFTSIGVNCGKFKGSVAYSESCYTFSVGYSIVGNNILPSWGGSKTWYDQIGVFNL